MGLTRGSLSGGARPALPALLREGKRSTGLYPAPCSGTRASARQAMHQGPWQPPGHHPVLKTPSSLASGTASAADSCKKCWVQVQVPWEGGGKVQPGSATKYGKNRNDRNHIAESNAFTPDLAADAGYGEGQVQGSRGRAGGGHGRVPALVPGQGVSRPSLRVCNRFLVLLVGKRSPRFGDKGIVPRVGEERSRGKAGSMTSQSVSPWQTGREQRPGAGMCFG